MKATIHSAAWRRRDGLWRRCVALSSGDAGDCCSAGSEHGKIVCVPVLHSFLLVDVPFVMQRQVPQFAVHFKDELRLP